MSATTAPTVKLHRIAAGHYIHEGGKHKILRTEWERDNQPGRVDYTWEIATLGDYGWEVGGIGFMRKRDAVADLAKRLREAEPS